MRSNKMMFAVCGAAALVVVAVVLVLASMFKKPAQSGTSAPGATATAQPSATPAPADGTQPAGDDAQAVQQTAVQFYESYFVSDPEALRECLVADYAQEDAVYGGNGAISGITVTVEGDVAGAQDGATCTVRIDYKDSDAGDAPQALSLSMVKQSGAWKVSAYGPAA